MSQLGLDEMLMYGEQLLTVLVGDNTEAATMHNIHEISRQVIAIRQKQMQQMKEDVEYLTREVGVSDGAGDSNSTPDDLASIETLLQNKVEAVSTQSSTVIRECQQLKEGLTKAQRELETLKEQRQSQKDAITAALPKARCDANLYSNITNLRWQFNTEPHEVKGYICNNAGVKTFNLNSQEVSRFFITNYLWDLIEEDW
ncbi:kinetochore protein spc24-like [Littorina saxatilis]|uniref:Kinetochore protein Spc24 n=1 Tax=Littorina saxatilis TaxID=31220 RepID=A0AAN9BUF9_9CAEN